MSNSLAVIEPMDTIDVVTDSGFLTCFVVHVEFNQRPELVRKQYKCVSICDLQE